jgi:antitoxin VapB
MAVLIKDKETDRLIRALAERTGETMTEAVRKAAQERLERLPPRKGRVDHARLMRSIAYFQSLPRANEERSDDEIVGYNDEGHFD